MKNSKTTPTPCDYSTAKAIAERVIKAKIAEQAKICQKFVKDVRTCSACLHCRQCKQRGRPTMTAMTIKSLIDLLPVLRGKMDIISEAPSKVEILPARDEEKEAGAICVAKVSFKIRNVWHVRFVPVFYGEEPECAMNDILLIADYMSKEGLRR